MPFFSSDKQSKDAKDKFERRYQDYQRDLDTINTWDFSNLEMNDIPDDVLQWMLMLNKKALILANNHIHSLPSNCFPCLDRLVVLDLSHNKLKHLPPSIGNLISLLELDVSNNKLVDVPSQISSIHKLQILNISGNDISDFPYHISSLTKLRTLRISDNRIKFLPESVGQLKLLKVFCVEGNPINYPPKEVCRSGLKSIMEFLSKEKFCVIESLPDDFDRSALDDPAYLERLLRASERQKMLSTSQLKSMEEQDGLISNYLKRQREEEQRLLKSLLDTEEMRSREISDLAKEQDRKRNEWFKVLSELESQTQSAIDDIVKIQEKNRAVSEALILQENERIKQENLIKFKQADYEALREKEVKASMEKYLVEMFELEKQAKQRDSFTRSQANQVIQEIARENEELAWNLQQKDKKDSQFLEKVMEEEALQKEMVRQVLLAQDSQRSQLLQQVGLIEQQLMKLTKMELKNRDMEMEKSQQKAIIDARSQLSSLLEKVHREKDEREKQIKQYLIDMETQRQEESDQYWLVQYQKLLQSKPASIARKEFELDIGIVKLLNSCGAEEYVPIFAKHRIAPSNLQSLNDENLRLMGMSEIGLRATVLAKISDYLAEHKLEDLNPYREKPSAPPPSAFDFKPSAPALVDIAAPTQGDISLPRTIHLESECCICMERKAEVVFFPCGHVCCCENCSSGTEMCPLCRAKISTCMHLHYSGTT